MKKQKCTRVNIVFLKGQFFYCTCCICLNYLTSGSLLAPEQTKLNKPETCKTERKKDRGTYFWSTQFYVFYR